MNISSVTFVIKAISKSHEENDMSIRFINVVNITLETNWGQVYITHIPRDNSRCHEKHTRDLQSHDHELHLWCVFSINVFFNMLKSAPKSTLKTTNLIGAKWDLSNCTRKLEDTFLKLNKNVAVWRISKIQDRQQPPIGGNVGQISFPWRVKSFYRCSHGNLEVGILDYWLGEYFNIKIISKF